ncbi:leishmanolysin-related zinc metalloendopeptidase [Sediminicola sp. YIK13]|uniref:leishmanolysin-related zinc metalloendopeptidase n=1 Tax=Sediminicola sp. YIK13 TaxID=1453352 RepID=UPI000781DC50|nr:leishmanolysin-related zinc metalloendopeptidase [Sediminicola sp. YIK13]
MKNTLQKSGRFIAFGCVLSTLLFISCSEEVLESDAQILSEDQGLEIALKADPLEPIIIDDLTPTVLKTTEAAGEDRGRFNITLRYAETPTDRQKEVFEAAAARWERIIIKDVSSFTGSLPSAFENVPDIEGTIDDIVIEVLLRPIDGPRGILGRAGPRFIRLDNFLTLSGVMEFDSDDLAFLDQLDLFEDVIVHEMGHVLGIGTLWNLNFPQFNFSRNLLTGTFQQPFFAGDNANVFWNAEGGTGELPIENEFGPGTRFGHWKESTLNNELMTGFLNFGENPLSRITAASMRDLGYGSATVGESYALPKGTPGVDINELSRTEENSGLNIAEMEVLLKPIGFVSTKKE